jgi:orotate phosphoribosyltransferase
LKTFPRAGRQHRIAHSLPISPFKHTVAEIGFPDPRTFERRRLMEEAWLDEFKRVGALWLHDDNCNRPHALLTSEKHSSGFFNADRVIEDPSLLKDACARLVHLLERVLHPVRIDRVMGPAMGAVTIAFSVAGAIQDRHLSPNDTSWGYFEKIGEGPEKRMTIPRANVRKGDRILLVEDVITTAGSLVLAERAVFDKEAIIIPFVLALVNRSGHMVANGNSIIALIEHPMPTWAPEECPLCKQGSEAIRPKEGGNWQRLNDNY